MRRFFNIVLIVSVLAMLPVVAGAQWTDKGDLGQWTAASVSRIHNYEGELLLTGIRVAKNNGFDRLVFEFKAGMPNYQIHFERGPAFENTAERKIRVRGRFFITINLQTLPYPESDSKYADVKLPERVRGMKLFTQMKEIEWFEGVRFFAVGLDLKRPFRVTELKNPSRLVIDFRY